MKRMEEMIGIKIPSATIITILDSKVFKNILYLENCSFSPQISEIFEGSQQFHKNSLNLVERE
ncbi:MAG: hypothetical protein ACFFCS_12325 [Candidatus Hodarchaeota archaeon]